MTQIFKLDKVSRQPEYHVMAHADNCGETFTQQARNVLDQLYKTFDTLKAQPMMVRFFISDASNQEAALLEMLPPHEYAVSIIQQPPLDGGKIAAWAWLREGVSARRLDNGLTVVTGDGAFVHCFSASNRDDSGVTSSEAQMRHLFNQYIQQLKDMDCILLDNCVRTWIYVQNVDVNYAGIVRARNDVFNRNGLTPTTHFIASTGINGRSAKWSEIVQLDTYAVAGLKAEQVKYLQAKDYLNSTIEYGVAFERGTRVRYADRDHVFISGTASIDNKGEVVHVGDIAKQVQRMWLNVEKLLEEAECTFDDVAQMVVYLRDPADYQVVNSMFRDRFPFTPRVITLAPVCRPQWLIEMECIAERARY